MMKEALRSILPERTSFKLLAKALGRAVQQGSLVVVDPWGQRHVFGTDDTPTASIRLTDPRTSARVLADPMLGVGEAYMDGTLILEGGSLRDFLMIGVSIANDFAKSPLAAGEFAGPFRKRQRRNPIARARANVAHHYDLSEDLYRLFLDPDLQYSCAYFQDGDESLEVAQAKKKRHIAAKLRLETGARVLDIGSGWGGLALELASRHGVEVDGLTLSDEQLRVAAARVSASGLEPHVRFHLRDYRHETGTYDRIVSVGSLNTSANRTTGSSSISCTDYWRRTGSPSSMRSDERVRQPKTTHGSRSISFPADTARHCRKCSRRSNIADYG